MEGSQVGLDRASEGWLRAQVSYEEWSDWKWQMRARVRSARELETWIDPTPEECEGVGRLADRFHFVITP